MRVKRDHSGNPDLEIELVFLARAPDAILLYAGQKDTERGDFVSLTLRGGHLEYRHGALGTIL